MEKIVSSSRSNYLIYRQDLFVVPEDSDNEGEREVTLDGKPRMDVAEDDEEGEMVDAEGNPLPEIQRRILEASRVKKPKIEVIGSQQADESEE